MPSSWTRCRSDRRRGDPRFSIERVAAIIRSVDHVHRAVSDMIGRLRPVGLDELGLVDAIEHCVDHWRQRLPEMKFDVSVSGNFDGLSEPATLPCTVSFRRA